MGSSSSEAAAAAAEAAAAFCSHVYAALSPLLIVAVTQSFGQISVAHDARCTCKMTHALRCQHHAAL
eukprot:6194051-Pleurochrysis_carterae.AAC.3